MFLEPLVFVFVTVVCLLLLAVKYIKRYAPENLILISLLAFAVGLYIPFAFYQVYIPLFLQVPIFVIAILVPVASIVLQYNNIILTRKLLYYRVRWNFKAKEYEKTIGLIGKLITLEGRKAEYIYWLGQCYKHTGDFINSRDSFALAIELDRNDYKSYFELGLVLDETNKKETAMVMFNKALKIKPDFYSAQEALGICLTSQGKFEAAVCVYQKALKYHPNSYELYYNIAMIESELKNYTAAIEAFQKAGSLKPDLYTAYYNLGKLCYMERRYEDAIAAYQNILHSTTYGPKGYYQLAICYCAKRDYERAMTALEYAMELEESYLKKAKGEYSFNPLKERIELYQKAKEKEKIKQMQKHNFMDQRFRIFHPKEEEEDSVTTVSIQEKVENHA